MKFTLFDRSEVLLRDGRTVERFHYRSEDFETRIVFNAGEDPLTWEIIGNASQSLSLKLINTFIEICAQDQHPVWDIRPRTRPIGSLINTLEVM